MKSFFLFVSLLILSNYSFGQPPGIPPSCGIYYSYDANGERIQKKYDCRNEEAGQDPIGNPLNPIIYPNPTEGPFTVGLNELVEFARLQVFKIDGMLIGTREAHNVYEMDYDISAQAPGSYLVTLFVTREGGAQAEEEFTLIKNE